MYGKKRYDYVGLDGEKQYYDGRRARSWDSVDWGQWYPYKYLRAQWDGWWGRGQRELVPYDYWKDERKDGVDDDTYRKGLRQSASAYKAIENMAGWQRAGREGLQGRFGEVGMEVLNYAGRRPLDGYVKQELAQLAADKNYGELNRHNAGIDPNFAAKQDNRMQIAKMQYLHDRRKRMRNVKRFWHRKMGSKRRRRMLRRRRFKY